jgi:hypothetical protein
MKKFLTLLAVLFPTLMFGQSISWRAPNLTQFTSNNFSLGIRGSGLTNLNATNITSGTLSPAIMATNPASAGNMLHATSATTAKWDAAPAGSGSALTNSETRDVSLLGTSNWISGDLGLGGTIYADELNTPIIGGVSNITISGIFTGNLSGGTNVQANDGYGVASTNYVNQMSNCLHLWRSPVDIKLPPTVCV